VQRLRRLWERRAACASTGDKLMLLLELSLPRCACCSCVPLGELELLLEREQQQQQQLADADEVMALALELEARAILPAVFGAASSARDVARLGVERMLQCARKNAVCSGTKRLPTPRDLSKASGANGGATLGRCRCRKPSDWDDRDHDRDRDSYRDTYDRDQDRDRDRDRDRDVDRRAADALLRELAAKEHRAATHIARSLPFDKRVLQPLSWAAATGFLDDSD
jgi:hypothetical protein